MPNARAGLKHCRVCRGNQCCGGGNLRCRQRDPKPSVIAGILDTYGGIRFIVTHQRALRHHVGPDELCIVVPDLTVHEPIAWGDIPFVVGRIEYAVDQWIKQRGIPNEDYAREAIVMYQLRCLESTKRSLDLSSIVET